MISDDSSFAPLSDESLYVAFLNDLEAATDALEVVREYAQRHPHLANEFRAMAEMRQNLDQFKSSDSVEAARLEQLGEFRIIRRVARGGMGDIYEAIQEPLSRRVALKTIRGQNRHLVGPLHARFVREQTVLARLHHTHIVPIHAAGSEGTLQYFAMSYIDGAAVHHIVRTAWLHESSGAHGQTPTLAILAAEAQSRLGHILQPDDVVQARPSGHPEPPAADDPTRTTEHPWEPMRVEPEHLAKPAVDSSPAGKGKGKGNGKLALSAKYYDSVARVMIDAAEAVQHAHDAGIIHRDLKPANLMVDLSAHCWVLDFGLAGYLKAQAQGRAPDGGGLSVPAAKPPIDLGPDVDPPTVSGVLGTPDYMAPEQFRGRADVRSDVWGLGVILYELLTLRRPFRGRKEIESTDPLQPKDVVQGLPLDLDAICRKAIQKEPAKRYQTARDFADDLRHWLEIEPVSARPIRTPRRVLLWAKRNKGWAAALAVATAALLAAGLTTVYVNKARADAAQALASAARKQQHEADARAAAERREAQIQRREAETQKRENWILQMQRIRLTYHRQGWSRMHWDLARRAVAIERDARIQAEAADSLAGLDSRVRKSFGFPAVALAFNRAGTRLAMGGSNAHRRETERPIQVWDRETDQLQIMAINGGALLAFGFRRDGALLLLKVPDKERASAELWDVANARLIRAVKSSLNGESAIQAIALSPDGTWFAASARQLKDNGEADEKGAVAVWETASGREVFRAATSQGTELALASDSSLLAAGQEDGRIMVWSLPKGDPIATFKADRIPVTSLAFGRDPSRRPNTNSSGSGWLLAAGDHGGSLSIWDLRENSLRSTGHNVASDPEILALAFSPDGMTLASTGRGAVVLWDIASGQVLLVTPGAGNYSTALAFSPDGGQLAVGGHSAFGWDEGVLVSDLEQRRGIDSLRGLRKHVALITVSEDSRLVGALSNDWRVGIWDRAARRLLHILEVTPGTYTDNAALAFSSDGRRLAFSAGQEASLWDVVTGEPITVWKLYPGLTDQLAFPEPNRLLIFRTETDTGELGPFGEVDPREHPRVCRIRNLLGPDPLKPLAEIRDCYSGVMAAVCSPDGKYYAVEGLAGFPSNPRRVANLYEGFTGKKLGALPTQLSVKQSNVSIYFDPTGTVMRYLYKLEKDYGSYFLRLPTLAVLRQLEGNPPGVGPQAKRWLTRSEATADEPGGLNLHEDGRIDPLVRFVLDRGNPFMLVGQPVFSRDNQHLFWGGPNGVTVVDLVEVNRRLSELGLGW
jgi:serine/threonine protein kinase/WD40 repeat protein